MSEFTYISKYKDPYGRVEYECKCSVCGKTCYYRRRVNKAPLCISCTKAKESIRSWELEKQKRQSLVNDAYKKSSKEHIKTTKDYMFKLSKDNPELLEYFLPLISQFEKLREEQLNGKE